MITLSRRLAFYVNSIFVSITFISDPIGFKILRIVYSLYTTIEGVIA